MPLRNLIEKEARGKVMMATFDPSKQVSAFLLELAAVVFLIITAPIWIPIAILLLTGGVIILALLVVVGIILYIVIAYEISFVALAGISIVGFLLFAFIKDSAAGNRSRGNAPSSEKDFKDFDYDRKQHLKKALHDSK